MSAALDNPVGWSRMFGTEPVALCPFLRLSWLRGRIERDAGASLEEIGYGQPKGLPAKLLRRGDIDRLGRRVGIDGLRVYGGSAHLLPALPLGHARHMAVETRHPRDDELVAICLVHAIAHAAADGRT